MVVGGKAVKCNASVPIPISIFQVRWEEIKPPIKNKNNRNDPQAMLGLCKFPPYPSPLH